MGKGKRLKKQRQDQTPRAPWVFVERAFELVQEHFGTESACVEAAAMLQGIVKHLGYDLEVRPVSLGVNDFTSGRSVVMGPKMLADLPEEQRAAANTENAPDGISLGHVVLTLSSPAYLMDPNLSQVNPMGINVPNIFSPLKSTDAVTPEDGQWRITTKDFDVVYVPDEGARPLLEDFGKFQAQEEADYRLIAAQLRRGGTVELNPRR